VAYNDTITSNSNRRVPGQSLGNIGATSEPALVVPPNPVFMNIKPSDVDALKALGYGETEARFLYIVATHSGYFVAR